VITPGTEGVEVEFYESVAVAFGLRPYLGGDNETATLLLAPAPEVVAAATASGAKPVAVELELPFATPARTVKWTAAGAGSAKLLSAPEQVLSFTLDGSLPATINQDVKITISLPSGASIVKWRRLMRAPPLPKGSFVQAVQVDHTTKSLLIDGRPHVGMGFYLVSRSGAPRLAHALRCCWRPLTRAAFSLPGRPWACT
jgi:hypothetical protein